MSTLKTPSVLAFEAKLACSDAIMYSCNWDNRTNSEDCTPIQVNEKSVRGTISNRLKGAKASKIDAEVQKPNLQTVDNAALDFNKDTLKVVFTLRVLGNLDVPSTCNEPDYQTALAEKINKYIETYHFDELAQRYAYNLANGRFLWRNRVGAQDVEIRISSTDKSWTFNALDYSLRNFENRDDQIKAVAEVIKAGLSGNEATLLTVEAFVRLGEGQTVFPSQELVMNAGDKKSKYLYQVDNQAAMHSQKIGNALRTIDTWYLGDEVASPIAIEPYGSVTNRGIAYRKPKEKTDFYSILDAWMLKNKELTTEEAHYALAMLIRGGVFGE